MVRQKFVVDTALYCNLVTAGITDKAGDAPDSLAIYRCADDLSSYSPVLLLTALPFSQSMLRSGGALPIARYQNECLQLGKDWACSSRST